MQTWSLFGATANPSRPHSHHHDQGSNNNSNNSNTSKPGSFTWTLSYTYFGFGFGAVPPILGMIICVALSILYHYENTTATHCGVWNWLPSFSSAIGNNFPQTSVWRAAIAIMLLQRIIDAGIYYVFHKQTAVPMPSAAALFASQASSYLYAPLSTTFPSGKGRAGFSSSSPSSSSPCTFWLHRLVLRHQDLCNATHSSLLLLENAALALLTYVSSTEGFLAHEIGFIGFVLFSNLNMLMQLLLFAAKDAFGPLPPRLRQSLVWKKATFAAQLVAAVLAAYFYVRHMNHCESGVYSLFAVCEYSLVLANIAFHCTLVLDTPGLTMNFVYNEASPCLPSSSASSLSSSSSSTLPGAVQGGVGAVEG